VNWLELVITKSADWFSIGTLTLELAEDDFSVPETDSIVVVTVTVSGDSPDSAELEIVPLSRDQLPETSRSIDAATPGKLMHIQFTSVAY